MPRMTMLERAARELLGKKRERVIGVKPKITLPRLVFMEKPMPPDIEPVRKPPVRRKMLKRPC
jgi:hypothetical protein